MLYKINNDSFESIYQIDAILVKLESNSRKFDIIIKLKILRK